MNKVVKVVRRYGAICFIIQTEGDNDFWYWEIGEGDWNDYWKDKCHACLIGNIMEWAANEFVNSEENDTIGCSCCSFLSISEAINSYLGIETIEF